MREAAFTFYHSLKGILISLISIRQFEEPFVSLTPSELYFLAIIDLLIGLPYFLSKSMSSALTLPHIDLILLVMHVQKVVFS